MNFKNGDNTVFSLVCSTRKQLLNNYRTFLTKLFIIHSVLLLFSSSFLSVFKIKMPHFRIETNVPRSKVPADFVTKAVPILAKALGKPEQYCVVSIFPDVAMSFGGSTEPCAIASLMSIGALGVEQNKKHAKVLFQLVEDELGVKNDRMYITFLDEPTANVGFKGTTFHDIFG